MKLAISELDRRIAAYHRMIKLLGRREADKQAIKQLNDRLMLDMSTRALLKCEEGTGRME